MNWNWRALFKTWKVRRARKSSPAPISSDTLLQQLDKGNLPRFHGQGPYCPRQGTQLRQSHTLSALDGQVLCNNPRRAPNIVWWRNETWAFGEERVEKRGPDHGHFLSFTRATSASYLAAIRSMKVNCASPLPRVRVKGFSDFLNIFPVWGPWTLKPWDLPLVSGTYFITWNYLYPSQLSVQGFENEITYSTESPPRSNLQLSRGWGLQVIK